MSGDVSTAGINTAGGHFLWKVVGKSPLVAQQSPVGLPMLLATPKDLLLWHLQRHYHLKYNSYPSFPRALANALLSAI